jgi:hypothetical protein
MKRKFFVTIFFILVLFTINGCGTILKITDITYKKSENIDYIVLFSDIILGGFITFSTANTVVKTGVFFLTPLLIDFLTGSIYLKENTTSIE